MGPRRCESGEGIFNEEKNWAIRDNKILKLKCSDNDVSIDNKHRLIQCDQIGRFLKVLGNKVPCKSSPNIEQHFRLLWKMALVMLHWCGYFLGTFWWKLGYFLLQHLVTHACLFTLAFWLNTSQRIFTVKGSITVQMTSYLTVLYSTKEGIKHLLDISSKAVEFKQEESRTEILPPYEVTE